MRLLLQRLSLRLMPLHEARTPAEREAIYRFRYDIYGLELRRDYPGMDHARRRLAQDEDEAPEARLYYTGTPEQVTGTARARIWDQPPADVVEELGLDRILARLPAGAPRRIAYLERLMVQPTARGRLLLPAILWHGYEHLQREGVDLCVLTCVPGLARHYVRLGARTYGAGLVEGASAAEVPLLILMHDVAHLRRVRSFLVPKARRLARPYDAAALEPLFDPAVQPVRFDVREVLPAIERARPPMFEGVAPRAVERVARRAYLLDVPAGGLVVREGTAEREMFVVLAGALEVRAAGERAGERVLVRAGQPVGEVAFLGTPGVRTATVVAQERSTLLVLRRRFLDDLAADHPADAYRITRQLARLVADRFA